MLWGMVRLWTWLRGLMKPPEPPQCPYCREKSELVEVNGYTAFCSVCAKTWALPLPAQPKSVV